ncbi:GntR family transcriptional regulator [Paenibacillus baekrokdamisoli]|uniref:GntR family transcriptional regulator n=1 Tax=Paenibacillus baekrokdamisoli TaxID=1712516 RepID=A0A3G9J9U2_9BACL|nr:FadR/GntR family transcriptional regulator [Paenibacillus baekrokdamisoli]MBB3070695.1 DNA-binding FadR family transcriptional regulator [Paenibacillus baekrokdamisoli]BBH20044.1 GntR family transcriptional regulator [Paenibacillus baekrokdamisoli]
MLTKTTRLNLVDQVILQIESLIESGEWQVGKKIPAEPELVVELNVSRNTLREGIRALCHAGVLMTKQGDGTYVSSGSTLGAAIQRRIQKSSLLDTLEVRNALEQEAARLAAERRTEQDLEKIWFYHQECSSFTVSRDMEQYVAADMKLHQTIVESTGNQMLIDLYAHITEAIQESITIYLRKRFTDKLPQDEHHQLVEAIAAQDSKAAAKNVQQFFDQLKRDIEMEEM